MNIVNKSKLKKKDIVPLVDFVSKRMPHSKSGTLFISDHRRQPKQIRENVLLVPKGSRFGLTGAMLENKCIWIMRFPKGSFPGTTSKNINFKNWQECFIFVLTHELSHRKKRDRNEMVELRCDLDAMNVLGAFRGIIGKRQTEEDRASRLLAALSCKG